MTLRVRFVGTGSAEHFAFKSGEGDRLTQEFQAYLQSPSRTDAAPVGGTYALNNGHTLIVSFTHIVSLEMVPQ